MFTDCATMCRGACIRGLMMQKSRDFLEYLMTNWHPLGLTQASA